MATDISICSAALIMLNADEITSFEDETREARLCSLLYSTTRDSLLQMHPWRFSLNQVQLARLSDTPMYGFSYGFQLPATTLRVIGTDSPAIPFEIYEDMLYSNADEIKATIQFQPSEVDFPAYFVRALEYKMAEVLATALLGDESKMQLFERAATRQLQAARSIDSQNQPTLTFNDTNFSLINVRHI